MSSDIILPTQSLEYFFIVWMAKADNKNQHHWQDFKYQVSPKAK